MSPVQVRLPLLGGVVRNRNHSQTSAKPRFFHALWFSLASLSLALPVDVLAMPNADHKHDQLPIVNFVNDAIVTNSNSPCVLLADQRHAISQAGIVLQSFHRVYNSDARGRWPPVQRLFGGWIDDDGVSHRLPVPSCRSSSFVFESRGTRRDRGHAGQRVAVRSG